MERNACGKTRVRCRIVSNHSERVTTVQELSRTVSEAREACSRLRIVAGGSWLDAGRPTECDVTLDVSALSGIVDYVPGDFTLTARAGTTLLELDEVTRSHGQFVPLDPFGSRTGTLGATLATASAGPRAASAGTPRDVALGVTFVDGTGAVVSSGGRVVKNVAGFDLVRLAIGAWGTLGVIAEATVRMRATPPADATVAVPLPSAGQALADHLRTIDIPALQPAAATLLNARAARGCGSGGETTVLLRLCGNASSVRDRLDALARRVAVEAVPDDVWRRVALAELPDSSTVRLSASITLLPALWKELEDRLGSADVSLIGCAVRGVVRASVPKELDTWLGSILMQAPPNSTALCERLRSGTWPGPSPRLTHRLSVEARRAFDPAGILNTGILVPLAT